MKKSFALLLAIMMLISATASFAESNSNSRYFDDETGVSFSVRDNWEIVPNVSGNQDIKISYALTDDSTVSVTLSRMDLWSVFKLSKYGIAREEVDFTFLDDDVLTYLVGETVLKTKEVKRYGDYQYYVVTYKTETVKSGLTFKVDHESAITMVNGFVLMFSYSTFANYDEYHQEFEDLLNSVSIQDSADNSAGSNTESAQAQGDQNASVTEQTKAEGTNSFISDRGIKFGMTVQEVQDIEEQKHTELDDIYVDSNAYEIWYEKDIQLYSINCLRVQYDFDLNDQRLFTLHYVSKGGVTDYKYAVKKITKQYGDPIIVYNNENSYSLLYEQIGRNSHIDDTHWLISDDEMQLGIDAWYNDYDTVFIVFYDPSNPASYGLLQKKYSDESGISFVYPEGWDGVEFTNLMVDLTSIKVSLNPRGNSDATMQYARVDMWEDWEKTFGPLGFTREDIGPDFLEEETISLIMQIEPLNLRTIVCNNVKLQVFEYQTDNNGKADKNNICSAALTMRDAYLHMFVFSSKSKFDEYYPAFEQMISTVSFNDSQEQKSSGTEAAQQAKDQNKYTFSDPDFQVTIPDDFIVFWRGMPEDAEAFSVTGETAEMWNEIFDESKDILVWAELKDQSKQINVFCTDDISADFAHYSDTDITRYIKAVLSQQDQKDHGYSDCSYCILETTQNKFIMNNGVRNDEERPYTASAFTVDGEKRTMILYYSATPITEDDLNNLKEIACSIVMNGVSQEFVSKSDWIGNDEVAYYSYVSDDMRFNLPDNAGLYDYNISEDDLILRMRKDTVADIRNALDTDSALFYLFYQSSDGFPYMDLKEGDMDLPDFSGDQLINIKKYLKVHADAWTANGYSVKATDLIYGKYLDSGFTSHDLIWLKVKISAKDILLFEYLTVVNKKMFVFTVYSKTETEELEKETDRIIESSTYLKMGS